MDGSLYHNISYIYIYYIHIYIVNICYIQYIYIDVTVYILIYVCKYIYIHSDIVHQYLWKSRQKKDGVNTSLAVAGAPEAPQLDLEGRAVCNALPLQPR